MKSSMQKTLVAVAGATGLFVIGGTAAHADTVKIQAGDTVWGFAQKYHVSVQDIVKQNKLADANLIIAGHEINIPAATSTNSSKDAATSTNNTVGNATSQSATNNESSVDSASTQSSATDANNGTNNTANSSVAPSGSSHNVGTVASSAHYNVSGVYGGGVEQALAFARQRVPYVWGGNTPSGFDCSGLVQYVFGLSARSTYQQASLGSHHYDVENAPYGSLVFFGSDSAPYHVGISLGGGRYVHAATPSDGIRVGSSQYYRPSFYVVIGQ